MKLTFRGNSYQTSAPIELASDSTDSTNTNDWLVEDFPESTQVTVAEKRLGFAYASRSHLSRFLRNPFFRWLRLADLSQATKTLSESEVSEHSQFEQQEAESMPELYLDTCFTDRVDPSLYYILFFWQLQFDCRANSDEFSKQSQKNKN